MTEAKLQVDVKKKLNEILLQRVFWTSVDVSNGTKNARRQQQLKNRGVKTGFPDAFMMWQDGGLKALCIELKFGSGGVSDEQIKIHKELAVLGVPTAVCWSVEDVLHALDVYDVPTII